MLLNNQFFQMLNMRLIAAKYFWFYDFRWIPPFHIMLVESETNLCYRFLSATQLIGAPVIVLIYINGSYKNGVEQSTSSTLWPVPCNQRKEEEMSNCCHLPLHFELIIVKNVFLFIYITFKGHFYRSYRSQFWYSKE